MKTSGYFVLGFIVIFLIISMTSAVSAGVFDFYQPSKANPDDKVFEQIGGDDFLNATLKGCAKIGENYIPDASFSTSEGNFTY